MKEAASISYKTIAPFLNNREGKNSRIFSYAGLATGVLLLLCCIQMYVNINQLLKEKNIRKNGYDFISVTKTITNENMGKNNTFSPAEIEELKNQPFIADAAPLLSNQFRVKASAGSIIPFSTDLFLESVRAEFIDTVPSNFTWRPGQTDIPIIFSADFLEMYNVFAPAQDLPQLSASSIATVNIILECYGVSGVQNFRARIVGVSDRINSVLVPENFLTWANQAFGNTTQVAAARVFLKTADANDPALLSFIDQKDYHINKDKTKFGRVKQILQAVVAGLGVFAILVILLALMLFSFYLQLMIARSKDNLQLLLTLGYSPGWLSKTVAKKWIPVYGLIILSALLLTILLQFIFQQTMSATTYDLSPMIHISVVITALILFVICILINYRLIKKSLFRL